HWKRATRERTDRPLTDVNGTFSPSAAGANRVPCCCPAAKCLTIRSRGRVAPARGVPPVVLSALPAAVTGVTCPLPALSAWMPQPRRWCASTNNPSTHARSALLGKLVARGLFLDAYLGLHGWANHVVGTGQPGLWVGAAGAAEAAGAAGAAEAAEAGAAEAAGTSGAEISGVMDVTGAGAPTA